MLQKTLFLIFVNLSICLFSQKVTIFKGENFAIQKDWKLQFIGKSTKYLIYMSNIDVIKVDIISLKLIDKFKINFIGLNEEIEKTKVYNDKLYVFTNKFKYKATKSEILSSTVICYEFDLNTSFNNEKTETKIIQFQEDFKPYITIHDNFFEIQISNKFIRYDYNYNEISKNEDRMSQIGEKIEYKYISKYVEFPDQSSWPINHNYFYPILPSNINNRQNNFVFISGKFKHDKEYYKNQGYCSDVFLKIYDSLNKKISEIEIEPSYGIKILNFEAHCINNDSDILIWGLFQDKKNENNNIIGIFSKIVSIHSFKASEFNYKTLIDENINIDLENNQYSKILFTEKFINKVNVYHENKKYCYFKYDLTNCKINNNLFLIQFDKYKNTVSINIINKRNDCLNSKFIPKNSLDIIYEDKIIIFYFDNKNNANKLPIDLDLLSCNDDLNTLNFVYSVFDENKGFKNKNIVLNWQNDKYYLDFNQKCVVSNSMNTEIYLVGTNHNDKKCIIYKIIIEG